MATVQPTWLVRSRGAHPPTTRRAGHVPSDDPPSEPEWTFHVKVELTGFAGDAADHFKRSVLDFSGDLEQETSLLELADRADGSSSAVITPGMVSRANKLLRSGSSGIGGTTTSLILAQVAVLPSTIVAGVFGSYLHSLWQWAGLVGSGSIALICQIYMVLAVSRRRRA